MVNRQSVSMCCVRKKSCLRRCHRDDETGAESSKTKGIVVSRLDSRWETVNGENLVETTEMILDNVVDFT